MKINHSIEEHAETRQSPIIIIVMHMTLYSNLNLSYFRGAKASVQSQLLNVVRRQDGDDDTAGQERFEKQKIARGGLSDCL